MANAVAGQVAIDPVTSTAMTSGLAELEVTCWVGVMIFWLGAERRS